VTSTIVDQHLGSFGQISPEAKKLSSREVAEMIGVTMTNLRKLRSRGDFPEPDGSFTAPDGVWLPGDQAPFWRLSTVRRWKPPQRKPGRPRKKKEQS
jgi:hypothetical protein